MSQGDNISYTADCSVCGVSNSSPDLTCTDTEPGATSESGMNGNSDSLSDDAFTVKLDDLGVEVVRDRDRDTSYCKDRLEATQQSARYEATDTIDDVLDKERWEERATTQKNETGYSLRKIPKSKTFDSGMVPYSSSSNNDTQRLSYDFSAQNRISSSQTHVFMTSQECFVVPGCKLPRETIASRLRFEKQHLSHDKICGYDDYLTPLQRKDKLIKDLKRQVRELTICLDDKDKEIEMYKQHVTEETSKVVRLMCSKSVCVIIRSVGPGRFSMRLFK